MIRFRLFSATVLLSLSMSAQADIQFAIGEPAADSVKSGVGQISGWAVSDVAITSVEAFINGVSVGQVPYGGTRLDVAAAFPDIPESEFSGWAMKWNYSLLPDGEHVLTVLITDENGAQASQDVTFESTGFKSEFISDPDQVRTVDSVISTPENGLIVITGAEVEGETVDVELRWDTASQQFLISRIDREAPVKLNRSPSADAGPDLEVETGANVVIEGGGSDPDGMVESFAWLQVTGSAVDLIGANTRTVQFTAPDEAGTIRLRLTVTDNDGASDQDDTLIEISEPAPEPPPEPPPEPENQPPSADAGPDQSVAQGENVSVPGAGSDPDGTITAWSWTQVSGTSVSLSGATTPEAQFTAPASAGDIRLRLTVTDDDGATGSDDVVITVEETAEPDPTTGETLPSMLTIINDARAEARSCGGTEYPAQPPLSWSTSLANIARLHSMDMAREGYFSHTSLDGTRMGDRVFAHWGGTRVGENIAASSIDRSDSYVVGLWLDSPGHCALIMDADFTHAGIGSGHNTENGFSSHHFWTLDFGG